MYNGTIQSRRDFFEIAADFDVKINFLETDPRTATVTVILSKTHSSPAMIEPFKKYVRENVIASIAYLHFVIE